MEYQIDMVRAQYVGGLQDLQGTQGQAGPAQEQDWPGRDISGIWYYAPQGVKGWTIVDSTDLAWLCSGDSECEEVVSNPSELCEECELLMIMGTDPESDLLARLEEAPTVEELMEDWGPEGPGMDGAREILTAKGREEPQWRLPQDDIQDLSSGYYKDSAGSLGRYGRGRP